MISFLSEIALTPIRAIGRMFISPPKTKPQASPLSLDEDNHTESHLTPSHSTPQSRTLAGVQLANPPGTLLKSCEDEQGESYITSDVRKLSSPTPIFRRNLRPRAGKIVKFQSNSFRYKSKSKSKGSQSQSSKPPKPKITRRKKSTKASQKLLTDPLVCTPLSQTSQVNTSLCPALSPEKFCYDDCKSETTSKSTMTKCCCCIRWFHDCCIKDKIQGAVIWNCTSCRLLPTIAQETIQRVKELASMVSHQYEVLQSFQSSMETIVSSSSLLVEEYNRERVRAEKATATIENLRQKLSLLSHLAPVTSIPSQPNEAPQVNNGQMRFITPTWSDSDNQKPDHVPENLHHEGTGPPKKQSDDLEHLDYQPSACVFGSSIIKRLNARRLSQECGADVSIHDKLYLVQNVTECVRKSDANIVVIHCGGNNLRTESAAKVIGRFKTLETVLINNKSVASVALSAITIRKANYNFNNKVRLVNTALQLICEVNGWTFIDNSGINRLCLNLDGIHLNERGQNLLHTNIADTLCEFYAFFCQSKNKQVR